MATLLQTHLKSCVVKIFILQNRMKSQKYFYILKKCINFFEIKWTDYKFTYF